jgi:hypothetical protein
MRWPLTVLAGHDCVADVVRTDFSLRLEQLLVWAPDGLARSGRHYSSALYVLFVLRAWLRCNAPA